MQRFLTVSEVATRTGLSRNTIRYYARTCRMPEPDVLVGHVQGWSEETIDQWNRTRNRREM